MTNTNAPTWPIGWVGALSCFLGTFALGKPAHRCGVSWAIITVIGRKGQAMANMESILTGREDESLITRQFFLTLRRTLWKHQQHLLANPDPGDDWWFLVDPNAPEPGKSDWQTGADTR